MSLTLLVANALGAAGFGALLVSSSAATRRGILVAGGIGSVLLVFHWLLLDRPLAAGMNLIYLMASVLGVLAATGRVPARLSWGLLPLALAVGALGYGSPADLLALGGTLVGLGSLNLERLNRLRGGLLLSHLVWALFGLLTGSVFRVVFSGLMSAGLLRAMRRETAATVVAPAACPAA